VSETTNPPAPWTAEDFYKGASRPNNAPPTPTQKLTAPTATKTEAEVRAESFYEKATKVFPGVTGKAVQPVQPIPPAAPATPAAAAAAAAAAAPAAPPMMESATAELQALGVTIPDGATLNPALVGEFAPIAKAAGLSKDHAQAFVGLHEKIIAAEREATAEVTAAERRSWGASSRRDIPAHKIASAVSLVRDHGTDRLRTMLAETGVGDHPALIEFLAELATERTNR
jgi:hypothetical protein